MSDAEEETARLQTQIGVSINLARQVVASWLPPDNDASQPAPVQVKARSAGRAGLGHTASNMGEPDTTSLSLEELKLKRRLAQQQKARLTAQQERSQRSHQKHARDDDDSDEEQEMRKGKSAAKPKKVPTYDAFTKKKQKKIHR